MLMYPVDCKDANCVANAKIEQLFSSDGVSRLGLGLKIRPETQFCESRSRRFQVSCRSRRLHVSVTTLIVLRLVILKDMA